MTLDINALIRDETERQTEIGKSIKEMVNSGKIVSTEANVKLLKKIIFSKVPNREKFCLSGFPDLREQAETFDKQCCAIKAIIYATGRDNFVEIKNQNINNPSIDAAFAKKFKLRPMREWSLQAFEDNLGMKTNWAFITGRPLCGKSTVA